MIAHRQLQTLVEAAIGGDQRAWERLVAEFTPMIRGIARRHRLTPSDQDDVVQRTFLALVRHVGRLRCPHSMPGWIATTARRECLFAIRDRGREIPTAEVMEPRAHESGYDERLLEAERREAVRSAAARMPARQRALVTALAMEPPLSQRQISERLGMPMGSIGPTRRRALERMRKDPRVSLLLDDHVPAAHRPTRPLREPIQVH